VTRLLDQYRTPTGYRPYTAVTATARADLQARLQALAEDLSALVSALDR
jgi:iron uptake system EfeUOB component EfeO/EfeM